MSKIMTAIFGSFVQLSELASDEQIFVRFCLLEYQRTTARLVWTGVSGLNPNNLF